MTDVTEADISATADLFEAMGKTIDAMVIRRTGIRGSAHKAAAEFLAAHREAAVAAERERGQKLAEMLIYIAETSNDEHVAKKAWEALAAWEAGK